MPPLLSCRRPSGLPFSAAGFLVGFDKFMNLLLKDVEEDYTVMVQASLQILHCASALSASKVGDSSGGRSLH